MDQLIMRYMVATTCSPASLPAKKKSACPMPIFGIPFVDAGKLAGEKLRSVR